jgi:hypothetical protein
MFIIYVEIFFHKYDFLFLANPLQFFFFFNIAFEYKNIVTLLFSYDAQ